MRISTSAQCPRKITTHPTHSLPIPIQRRTVLLSVIASTAWFQSSKRSFAEEFATFYGKATPPTSYGGYGGNAEETPQYRFDYPEGWTSQPVNKVQKGTQGIDARVFNPRNRNMAVFVIVLGRAGEDNKSFSVMDVEATFQGFAGADYDIQDAVMSATNTETTQREIDGQKYYDYIVDSPVAHYMATITIKSGKVFAFFVKSPDSSYSANKPLLTTILQSFRTL